MMFEQMMKSAQEALTIKDNPFPRGYLPQVADLYWRDWRMLFLYAEGQRRGIGMLPLWKCLQCEHLTRGGVCPEECVLCGPVHGWTVVTDNAPTWCVYLDLTNPATGEGLCGMFASEKEAQFLHPAYEIEKSITVRPDIPWREALRLLRSAH